MSLIPPKPEARADKVSVWKHIRLFRKDIFSSQPAKLYRAWMAEFRMIFFHSYFVNDPALLDLVLKERPDDFPKSEIVSASLASLLGQSVFVTNGETWKRQRRIIDPAFEGGRIKDVFPSMLEAAEAGSSRLAALADGKPFEVEEQTSQMAADVIFRTLFSIPITDDIATETFETFRAYQRTQPLMSVASLLKIKRFVKFAQRPSTKATSRRIRGLLTRLTMDRAALIAQGRAPDDLATKIMTMQDPQTGDTFTSEEMVDQVAIFFLAGHETSASAMAWTLYLLAAAPEIQERVAAEVATVAEKGFSFAGLSKLGFTRDVFREALRLYPPVPMMVREAINPEEFRARKIRVGSQIVLSPWHLHRHERLWNNPDMFDPDRWKTAQTKESQRKAYMPFSAGPRVCTGAGFAMIEGVVLLAVLLRDYRFEIVAEKTPVPVAHLTVRAEDGIWLSAVPRSRENT